MRKRALVAFAVVGVLLAVSAQPVGAANASSSLEVASGNTTGSDFTNSTTLSNVSVQGSGTSASVSMKGVYNPVEDEGDGDAESTYRIAGDDQFDNTRRMEVEIQPQIDGEISTISPHIASVDGADYGFTIDVYIVQESVDGAVGEGTQVATWDPDFTTGVQTVDIQDYSVTAGTTYTIEFVTSTSDNDGTADRLHLSTDDSATSAWLGYAGGTVNQYGNISIDLGVPTSGTYVSGTHAAEDVQQGFTNLTLQNASAAVEWVTDADGDGTFETTVASNTYTTSGNKTLALDQSHDDWRVDVSFDRQSGTTTAKLHDEGVLFDASGPSGSNADPTGEITSYDGDVSLDVSDSDFALAQGDQVQVTLTNSTGAQLNQTTISSNQTVAFDYDARAGASELTWTLNDSYGQTTTVEQSFATPAILNVRNETAPRNLIDSPDANVTVTFFSGETVETREVTGGTADLSGLPVDEEFVAVINADGYHTRRIIIPSLFEQQTAYLLPETATSADVVFRLDDRTGNFPSRQTRLYIEKAINVSGGTDYRVISADTFGSTGEYATTLQDSTRYRLRVRNDDGDTRILGSYTAAGDDSATIPIGDIAVGATVDRGTAFQTSIDEDDSGQQFARVTYRDPGENTTNIEYRVVLPNGTAVTTVNESGPYGAYRATHPLPDNVTEATLNYSITQGTGSNQVVVSKNQSVGDVRELDLPVDKQVLSLMSWVAIVGLTGLVVIWDSRMATLVGVGAASLLTGIGAVQIPSMALGLAGVTAVLLNVGRGGGR